MQFNDTEYTGYKMNDYNPNDRYKFNTRPNNGLCMCETCDKLDGRFMFDCDENQVIRFYSELYRHKQESQKKEH